MPTRWDHLRVNKNKLMCFISSRALSLLISTLVILSGMAMSAHAATSGETTTQSSDENSSVMGFVTRSSTNSESVRRLNEMGVGQTFVYNGITGTILKYDSAQGKPGAMSGFELLPQSSIFSANDIGSRSHTFIRILVPTSGKSVVPTSHSQALANLEEARGNPNYKPPGNFSILANTPASLACVYNLAPQPVNQPAGCNPNLTSVNPSGGGGAIALIDPYDDPTAAVDLAFFSKYFGLPAANFTLVYAGGPAPYVSGTKPSFMGGTDVEEEALDIEWAHAMAPSAKIFLVEAQNNQLANILTAIQAAQYLVSQNGGGQISMSFGFGDFVGETTVDPVLAAAPANVVQLASAGDTGSQVNWPSASPYAISVGGTSFNRDGSGNFINETTWSDTGGGLSTQELRPTFQNITSVEAVVGTARGTPDFSMLADPDTGVVIYQGGQWIIVGGTSLSSPLLAGLLNLSDSANSSFSSQSQTIQTLYENGFKGVDTNDITTGSCGANSAMLGYDLCTGWGSINSAPYVATSVSCAPNGKVLGGAVSPNCVVNTQTPIDAGRPVRRY